LEKKQSTSAGKENCEFSSFLSQRAFLTRNFDQQLNPETKTKAIYIVAPELQEN
jgi:hypothetical protein